MVELGELPIPQRDWSSSDAPHALRKFNTLSALLLNPVKAERRRKSDNFLTDLDRR